LKKSLLLVVSLLAIASLLAVAAYTTATVNSDAEFSIVNTDQALLALIPNDAHNAAFLSGGSNAQTLKIDWDKGFGNDDFGIQPNSTYEWDNLFTVRNNSENDVHVRIYLDPDYTDTTLNVFYANARVATRWENIAGTPLEFDLAAGEETAINTRLTSGDGMGMKAKTVDFKMIVEATAVDGNGDGGDV
jgi:hypothetical protein